MGKKKLNLNWKPNKSPPGDQNQADQISYTENQFPK